MYKRQVKAQLAAFATCVPPNIYAFHRYTRNSANLYFTQENQFQLDVYKRQIENSDNGNKSSEKSAPENVEEIEFKNISFTYPESDAVSYTHLNYS